MLQKKKRIYEIVLNLMLNLFNKTFRKAVEKPPVSNRTEYNKYTTPKRLSLSEGLWFSERLWANYRIFFPRVKMKWSGFHHPVNIISLKDSERIWRNICTNWAKPKITTGWMWFSRVSDSTALKISYDSAVEISAWAQNHLFNQSKKKKNRKKNIAVTLTTNVA